MVMHSSISMSQDAFFTGFRPQPIRNYSLAEFISESESSSKTVSPSHSLDQLRRLEPTIAPREQNEKNSLDTLSDIHRQSYLMADEQGRSTPPLSALQRIWLRWFTAYRLLVAVSIIINFIILLALLIPGRLAIQDTLTAVAVQLFAAVFVRNEEVINTSFGLVARIPSTRLPYSIRKTIADFHHYGGVHIGCAISAVAWYLVFGILRTTEFNRLMANNSVNWLHLLDFLTCWSFLLLIVLICIFSHPRLRTRFHNTFERTHRFIGWTSILVLWTNTIIRTRIDYPTGTRITNSPALYLLAFTTFLIVLPWTRIRRVPLRSTTISRREIRLTFPYANMPYCTTMRFSLSPLTEWHAFATIPSQNGFTADILISGLGDWTRQIVTSPPKQIYIRDPPASNFLTWAQIFNSVLLVGTGSGIGPLLSLMASPQIIQMKAMGKRVRVMWITRDADAECWGFVRDTISLADDTAVVFDTRMGKPDVAFEARYLAQKEGLEAVMVVSNKKVTDEVVGECKRVGIAGLGAVFDS